MWIRAWLTRELKERTGPPLTLSLPPPICSSTNNQYNTEIATGRLSLYTCGLYMYVCIAMSNNKRAGYIRRVYSQGLLQ